MCLRCIESNDVQLKILKMKNIICTILFNTIICSSFAQSLDWVKQFTGTSSSSSEIFKSETDSEGNLFLTGGFNDSVNFNLDSNTQQFYANNSGFLVKYDSSGNFLWVNVILGLQSGSFSFDNNNNIYIAGSYLDTIRFNDSIIITPSTSYDPILYKISSEGALISYVTLTGSGNEYGYHTNVDGNGNIYMVGTMLNSNSIDLNPGSGDNIVYGNGSFDGFLLKLDSNFNFIYGKSIGGTGQDLIEQIEVDRNDNIYLSGSFHNTVDFDLSDTGNYNLTAYSADGFILKLNSSGNFMWANQIGSSDWDSVDELEIDSNFNIYVAGIYSDTVDFNSSLQDTFLMISKGIYDIFLQKLDSAGSMVWAKSFGGTTFDRVTSMDMDRKGNIYTTGFFYGTVDFDSLHCNSVKSSYGVADMFVMKHNNYGSLVWNTVLGSSGGIAGIDDYPSAINYSMNNTIFMSGRFEDTLVFESNFSNQTLIATGEVDAFIIKLDNRVNSIISDTLSKTVCNSYFFNNTEINTSGIFYDFSNCDSIIELNLTINQISSNIVWVDSTLSVIENQGTYQWINCNNGTIINGENENYFSPTYSGNYAVIISSDNCSDTSSCFNFIHLDIKKLKDQKLSIHPNPFTTSLTINVEGGLDEGMRIRIIDLLGKEIINTPINSNVTQFAGNQFDQGVYIVELRNQEKVIGRSRVVKQ